MFAKKPQIKRRDRVDPLVNKERAMGLLFKEKNLLSWVAVGVLSLLLWALIFFFVFQIARGFYYKKAGHTYFGNLVAEIEAMDDVGIGSGSEEKKPSRPLPQDPQDNPLIISTRPEPKDEKPKEPSLDDGYSYVAITFDDGPHTEYERRLLALFKELGDGKATFFWVGVNIPGNDDVIKEVLAAGHEIGNHSNSHPPFTSLSKSQIEAELGSMETALRRVIDHHPTVMRLPYGDVNDAVLAAVDYPVIHWTVDTLDWQSRNVEAIEKVLLEEVKPGAVVLAHSIHPETIEAMEKALPKLYEKGFRFLTVTDLFKLYGHELKPHQQYFQP